MLLARWIVPLVLLPLAASALPAAEKSLSELELKTERVIIFKDGYSLIIKRGVATSDQDGEVYTDDVPDAAVLGSFWAVPEQGRLISMTAGWKTTKDSTPKDLPCKETLEILLANQGKQAKIELHDKAIIAGVIREVLVEKTENPITAGQLELLDLARATPTKPGPTAAIPGAMLSSRVSRIHPVVPLEAQTLTAVSGTNFVLRTEEGDVLLQVGQIRSILVKEMQTTLSRTLTTTRHTKRLTFKVEGAEKKHALSIMYFRPGIRWIPTYRIGLSDKLAENKQKKATISLQAELLNEAEDLENVPVDIVVGVPNFRFRGTPSPLILEATLRNALAEAAPDLMGNGSQQLSNAMYSQRSAEFRRDQAGANGLAQGTVNLPGELTASGSQDLFVYNLPKLSLGLGERIAVPIFTADTTYRDIYTWDVHVTKNDNAAAPSGAGVGSPLTLSKNEVWHQILLTNNTNVPWTTGAAMIMQGNQPLAQELLTYTPPKDEVRVPVTVSVDTRGSLTEKETGRDLKALQWDGYNYARIEREMQLDLCNNKAIEIEAEITVRVGGKATKASHDGSITLGDFNQADWIQYRGQPAVNNSSTITWKVKLKPGDNFEPTVNYHHFTRH
ncbi:hypothetical protein NA78x_001166 [Anatilimnocola sp. NA78]|uniref:hypothetical protein n=1 Tax=Anatilimnocola sp. NA78 TaxID=3415683 RepID=UPI003CE514C3